MTEVFSAGFPHSDISGSQDICSSPKLFAAYHVFHRLLVPRHPPYALSSITNFASIHGSNLRLHMHSVACVGNRSFFWFVFFECFFKLIVTSFDNNHLGCLDIWYKFCRRKTFTGMFVKSPLFYRHDCKWFCVSKINKSEKSLILSFFVLPTKFYLFLSFQFCMQFSRYIKMRYMENSCVWQTCLSKHRCFFMHWHFMPWPIEPKVLEVRILFNWYIYQSLETWVLGELLILSTKVVPGLCSGTSSCIQISNHW